MKKIVLTGGGTGGHLFPAIALGEELARRGYQVHLITDHRCQKYLNADLKLTTYILKFRLSRRNFIAKIYSSLVMLLATLQAWLILRRLKPSLMIGFGGYTSAPPVFAALFTGLPVIIHEPNCFMGVANKYFAKFVVKITLSHSETKNISNIYRHKIVVTGDIVRQNITNLSPKTAFDNPVFRIFIFGGSQGAEIFASLIPASIQAVIKLQPQIKLQITQQVAVKDQSIIQNIYSELGIAYQLADFFHNIADLYQSQDLVIARSGASTIAELTAAGLPALLIPLPSAANNHQFYNAKALEDHGAGWCFEQHKVTAGLLASKILELANNRNLLKQASLNLLKRKSCGVAILADLAVSIIS